MVLYLGLYACLSVCIHKLRTSQKTKIRLRISIYFFYHISVVKVNVNFKGGGIYKNNNTVPT